jgi:tetratricopeptide (TPR) repeat protein
MAPDTSAVTRAEGLIGAGRSDLAIAEFQRLIREQPEDEPTAALLADHLIAAAEAAAGSGRCADALAYLSVVANWRTMRGDRAAANDLRARMERVELANLEAQLDFGSDDSGSTAAAPAPRPAASPTRPAAPKDMRLQALRARVYVARGDATGAAYHLMPEMAEGDPVLLLAIAEIQLRAGQFDRGIALAESVIGTDPILGDEVVRLGIELADRQPDAGFLLVEMAADAWTEQGKWQKAADAFEQFVARKPDYVPAVVRLRETEAAAERALEEKRVIPFRPLRTA